MMTNTNGTISVLCESSVLSAVLSSPRLIFKTLAVVKKMELFAGSDIGWSGLR